MFSKIKTATRLIVDKDFRFNYLALKGRYNKLGDEEYLKRRYKAVFKRELNLDNPMMYTEKLQWIKLYDRNPLYTTMVDKYEAKNYVARIIGDDYIIPTLGVWDSFDKIDFDGLPNQFVLKCTHDSGGVVICTDKSKFDYSSARIKINKSLGSNYFWMGREWPYKNVKPRILAEEYMEDTETKELRDYKFFSFNGITRALFIATERQSPNEDTKFDFFDVNFNHLPFTNGHPNAKVPPVKPKKYDQMVEIANKLSEGFPHIRIDLYEVNNKIYFGELTFTHWGGFVPFNPEEWDLKFGKWINLPDVKKIGE
jgi:hypothetical protein